MRTKERCRLIERYLENLESGSVLSKRALLVEQRRCLEALRAEKVSWKPRELLSAHQ